MADRPAPATAPLALVTDQQIRDALPQALLTVWTQKSDLVSEGVNERAVIARVALRPTGCETQGRPRHPQWFPPRVGSPPDTVRRPSSPGEQADKAPVGDRALLLSWHLYDQAAQQTAAPRPTP